MPNVGAFLQDRGAAVAVIFALSLVPVAGVAGIALDYATARSAQRHLQAAVDAAALAGAARLGAPAGQVKKTAEDSFSTNMSAFPYAGEIKTPKVEVRSDRVEVSAAVDVPTSLSGILGISQMNVAADAIASTVSGQPLEIVFVVDVTQSMGWNGSFDTARTEIGNMLDGLQARMAGGDDIVMSFIPMSDRINVGTARGAAWLSAPAPGNWQGCVEPRVEAETGYPFMESARAPSELGFVPTPGQFSILRAAGIPQEMHTRGCKTAIIGPTTSINDLRTAMNSIQKDGTGRIDQGIVWAWRMLSPAWRGEWGRSGYPANTGERRKIAVLIGDGHSHGYYYEMGGTNGNPPAGEPYLGNVPTFLALEHMQELCSRMKADGIEIFVLYLNGTERARPYMQACASDPNAMYSVSDTSGLEQAFQDIGSSLVAQGGPRLVR
ncbi:pilus assembly protein TadG-related protein [Futiania mangrovi]|uniref:Pilus assembly protein TadG-related protein n=1 Tax=Futiania mangrovi TaxID=2959716 RepID=A0A9J6PGL8_9PROT|nr:pilus assembly protein TadG-related protein [Futiania mangrovii]MCP1337622.1 pilus assembly protein TadG-related protein [Futiania mangrovii]